MRRGTRANRSAVRTLQYWSLTPCSGLRCLHTALRPGTSCIQLTAGVLRSMLLTGVAATLKHFVGDGGTAFGTGREGLLDRGDTPINRLQRSIAPYITAINEHKAQAVMASYSSIDNIGCHENGYMLSNVLRGGCKREPVLNEWYRPTRTTCAHKRDGKNQVRCLASAIAARA
jgi:Glycosyl hydrolase family 3 N terminal domain